MVARRAEHLHVRGRGGWEGVGLGRVGAAYSSLKPAYGMHMSTMLICEAPESRAPG